MALTFLYSTSSFSSSSSLTRRFANYHFRLRNFPIPPHTWPLSSPSSSSYSLTCFFYDSLFIDRVCFVLIPALILLFIFFAAAFQLLLDWRFCWILDVGFVFFCLIRGFCNLGFRGMSWWLSFWWTFEFGFLVFFLGISWMSWCVCFYQRFEFGILVFYLGLVFF